MSLLHSNGIIPTDIKPQNLLFEYPFSKDDVISTDDQILNNRMRLIDFSSCNNDYPKPSVLCQSLYWRAPEVLLRLPYDTSIDVWSLGVVLLELFLGYTAFPGRSEFEVLHMIQQRVVGVSSRCNAQAVIPQSMIMRSPRRAELFSVVPVGVSLLRNSQKTHLYELHPLAEEQVRALVGGKALVARVVHEKPFPLNMAPAARQTEQRDRERFLALLNRMLCVNPLDRAPVETLLSFPFITVEACGACQT